MPEEGVTLSPKPSLMSADEVVEIATQFVHLGITKIRLTGGEPLVRKDAGEIMERLSKLPVELALTTNGILVDRYLEVFKNAKLHQINFSLDSLDTVKQLFITKRDYGQRILDNLNALLERDFNVKVNAVLMRGVNDDEIIPFVERTKDWKASIRFIEFMPFDGNQWEQSKYISHGEVLEQVYAHYGKEYVVELNRKPHQTARNYQIKGHRGSFGLISTVTKPFCGDCNRLRLTANGKLKNCLFSAGETDLLTAHRQGVPLEPLIRENVLAKKAVRGGMELPEEFANPQKNRSMILIGG